MRRLPTSYGSLVRLTLVAVALFAAPAAAAPAQHVAPKTANFYLRWTVTDEEARDLARWDVVILDMEVQSNTPGAIRLMRQLNPDITILAYVTAGEIRSDAKELGSVAPLRRDLLAAIPDAWFVTDANGNRRSFWSGTWIVNVTDRAPAVNGVRWNAYLPRFVNDRVLSTGLWDGVLYDNAWENVTYFAGGLVDLDRDGRADAAADADNAWREGLRTIYRNTRAVAPSRLVFENDGPLYAADVQGLQFENFPNGGWSTVMGRVARAASSVLPPKVIIVNTNTANTGNRDDYRKFRYGLGSALLADAYSSFDYGDQNHGQTWWYDEYDATLGAPAGAAARIDGTGTGWRAGVWRRDYRAGTVLVNSGTTAKAVQLGGDYERLHGTQDGAVNDGSVVRTITLPANDGALLLKPLGEVRGTAFQNGSFVRIFDAKGAVKRTGFFVQADRFSGSAMLLTRVAGGKNREVVAADGARVKVYDERGRLVADFAPYGPQFAGGIAVAVGDLDGAGDIRIVTATAEKGGGVVKVFSLVGTAIREFRAYGNAYTGGSSVAVGDLDGDGKAEIVTGAGPGGGPHVRVFDGAGKLVHPGFFVYNPKFRGGVRVAAGDLDGDGKAEIVTGAGPGGGPHVRVFDGGGRLKSEFFAFEPTRTSGVAVGVADTDGDGTPEILSFTKTIPGIASRPASVARTDGDAPLLSYAAE